MAQLGLYSYVILNVAVFQRSEEPALSGVEGDLPLNRPYAKAKLHPPAIVTS